MFDATASFRGKSKEKIDFSNISKTFPLRHAEIADGDLVAVGHSIFLNKYGTQVQLQFGLYFVVLLARESKSIKISKATSVAD